MPDANDATDGPGPVAIQSQESQEPVATTSPASTPKARVGSKKPAPKKAAKAPKKPGPPKLAPVSERMLMLQWFPELFLGVRSYPWQFKVLEALNYRHSRVALKASNGCLAAEQLIYDPVAKLSRRVDSIDGPFHVQAWDEKNGRLVTAQANRPFTKPVDALYEFEFGNGRRIRCSLGHRFLTPDRGWLPAKDIPDGALIVAPLGALDESGDPCERGRPASTLDTCLSGSRPSVPRCSHTAQGSLADCRSDSHSCGAQLLWAGVSDRASSPSQGGARAHTAAGACGPCDSGSPVSSRLPEGTPGGLERTPAHTPTYQEFDHPSNYSCALAQGGGHGEKSGFHSAGTSAKSSLSEQSGQRAGQDDLRCARASRPIPRLTEGSQCREQSVCSVCASCEDNATHIVQRRLLRSDVIWDFEVPVYHNYVAGGVANHNSGKTSSVVAAAILWHMMRFEGGVTVITAGVYRQIVDVLWPVLKARTANLGGAEMGWKVTEGRIEYTAPDWRMPSQCIGFTAEAPEKAEGWHARGAPGKEDHLLYIIDEAKGVSDQIFHAMERCQPTRVLVVSSPGGSAGAFYDIFRKPDTRYDLFTVTAHDCPHIKQEWIDEQIATYGEKSALIRSMIFAEFGEEDGNALVLPPTVLQKALSSPASKVKGVVRLGCDFAAGGDENVIAVAEGNYVKEVIRWREKDTMAAVGRFITEFRRLGVEAHNVYADGSGIGIPMCDALREAGWDVVRVNNGEAAVATEKFANRGTEMWVQFARLVETGKVIVPAEDELLHRQLTTRRLEHNSKGKLMVEPKDKMKGRGLSSPDRADALVLAYCGGSQSLDPYFARNGKQSPLAYLDEQEPVGSADKFAGCHAG